MFIEPTITRVPSRFSEYIIHMAWHKNCVKNNICKFGLSIDLTNCSSSSSSSRCRTGDINPQW